MRFVALFVAVFIFLSSLESWAGFWVASRWFVSSRYAGVSLGTVKNLLDRGIINSATQQAKVFVRKNGKWILLVLGLSQVISEVQSRIEAMQYCYVLHSSTGASAAIQSYSSRVLVSYADNSRSSQFWTYDYSCDGWSRDGSDPVHFPLYYVYKLSQSGNTGLQFWAYLPAEVSLTLRSRDRNPVNCAVQTRWLLSLRECNTPADSSWQNERRRVPVRVFPNVSDFLRDDVINSDPALRWLRDEYQRIASDSSIPTIPSDALDDLELPSVDWSIPEEEVVDGSATSSGEFEGSQEGEGQVSIPGLDTKLEPVQRKSFPLELINQLVQNHPLLRILSSVRFDVSGGGSCVFGEGYFTIDFCRWQWVLNLMGSFLVPLAFLYGLLGIGGRSDE